MIRTIYLLKIGKLNKSILLNLKKNLEDDLNIFSINVEILKERIKLRKEDFNSIRRQYKAGQLLKKVHEKARSKELFRILGILVKDIYSKNYNFIFGIAKRGSFAALISIARLKESFYIKSGILNRKVESKEMFNERVLKEAKHELGHTFGLEHCHNTCVMQLSDSLTDTDKKPVEFCESCFTELKTFLLK